MSSFKCEHCGEEIIDTQLGYVTGCKHYPTDRELLQAFWNNARLTDKLQFLSYYKPRRKSNATNSR